MNRYLAELFATFALVFAASAAVVVNERTGGAVTAMGCALTSGLVVMCMIYAIGDVSGAHLNPAVTLGFCAAGRMGAREACAYIAAQFLGAMVASVCVRMIFGPGTSLGAHTPAGPAMQSFVLEIILTAMLMFVILCVATGAKEKGIIAGMAIGGAVAFDSILGGPISGASMNPARSLGPALISGNFHYLWIYLIAPSLGAILAVPAWDAVRPKSLILPA